MNTNYFYSDQDRLDIVSRRIAESGIDLTANQRDWTLAAYACASLGEGGREAFHRISSNYPGYSREECDRHFGYCLRTSRNAVTIGTLILWAKQHGIDTSLPRGPRPRTEAEQKKERANRFRQMQQLVDSWFEVRYNTWKSRVDIRERPAGEWRSITERDLSTIYSRLLQQGVGVKLTDVKSLLESRDFARDYDVVGTWLEGLRPYDPSADPDYLHDFFTGHLIYEDAANVGFYQRMLEKWFVGMVALWTGCADENPVMPVFCGKQHVGKTWFVRHLLPPELRDYLKEPTPSDPVDKDYIISLSEVAMIFMDEFSIGSDTKSNAFKAIITSAQSNLRDSFGHFRETRKRKASLIGATNHACFIRDSEGNRRYLPVKLAATVNLNDHPLPYEGAYAQALWMLRSGFCTKPTQAESTAISDHNRDFMEPNDCEEALKVFLRRPTPTEPGVPYSAGELLQELSARGFRGHAFNSNNIGKALRAMGFAPKKIKGFNKYLVVVLDHTKVEAERKAEAAALAAERAEGATESGKEVDAEDVDGELPF